MGFSLPSFLYSTTMLPTTFLLVMSEQPFTVYRVCQLLKKIMNPLKKKSAAMRDLLWSISSCYLAHCSCLFFKSIRMVFSVSHIYAIWGSRDTNFVASVIYKPWVLSVSSETLVPITAILIPAAGCVLLLHYLVFGPIIIHLM